VFSDKCWAPVFGRRFPNHVMLQVSKFNSTAHSQPRTTCTLKNFPLSEAAEWNHRILFSTGHKRQSRESGTKEFCCQAHTHTHTHKHHAVGGVECAARRPPPRPTSQHNIISQSRQGRISEFSFRIRASRGAPPCLRGGLRAWNLR